MRLVTQTSQHHDVAPNHPMNSCCAGLHIVKEFIFRGVKAQIMKVLDHNEIQNFIEIHSLVLFAKLH